MKSLTTLEIVLIVCLIILTIQYLVSIYVFLSKEWATKKSLEIVDNIQKYSDELFRKLLNEEKITISLANQLKDLQNQKTNYNDKVTGLH